jgi:hypothetical protein
MARQIDPWVGVPQTVVLEENLLAVQLRLQGLDVKLREVEARLERVALVADEAKLDVDQASGQTLQLEAQLAGVAAALLMLTDQLCTAGPARSAPAGGSAAAGGPAPADVSAAVARKVTEILAEMLP